MGFVFCFLESWFIKSTKVAPKQAHGSCGRYIHRKCGWIQSRGSLVFVDREELLSVFAPCNLLCLFLPLPFPGCVLLSAVQAPGGHSPKTQNGLLSPPQEEKLSNSQTSLYEMLQEKGRWGGVSLDQSALLPLRFKNIREKTDAHFVDVIKEDR